MKPIKEIIGYTRVSTKEQGESGNGLEAQKQAIHKFAQDNGYKVLDIVQEVASGKRDVHERVKLREVIARSLKAKATIVVSNLNRLSRKASFIFNLMDTKVRFIVAELGENVNEMMIQFGAVMAEADRKSIGDNTRRSLAVLKSRGVQLGNPRVYDGLDENGQMKMGLKSARDIAAKSIGEKADAFAAMMRPTIERMLRDDMSFGAIARELNLTNTRTARGGEWATTTVSNLVRRW